MRSCSRCLARRGAAGDDRAIAPASRRAPWWSGSRRSGRGARAAVGPRRARPFDDGAADRRTSRSTRRPSAWSIPGTTIHGRALPDRRRRSSTSSTSRAETPLLAAARARGLRAANGSEMLIAQAAIAFERWTGVGGMADVMRAAVAPLLADATVARPDRCDSRRSSTAAGSRRRGARAIRVLPLRGLRASTSMREIARRRIGRSRSARGPGRDAQPRRRPGCRSTRSSSGPAVPDPGAIYTIGLNYRAGGRARTIPTARRGRSSTARLPTLGRRARRDAALGSGADAERRCRSASSAS